MLAAPCRLPTMLNPVAAPSEPALPETEEQLERVTVLTEIQAPLQPDRARLPHDASDEISGSTESESEVVQKGARRERLVARRKKQRLQRHLGSLLEGSEGLSFLEAKAISAKVARYYGHELECFMRHAKVPDLQTVKAKEMDLRLVSYFNHMYFKGEQSDRGDKCLASLIHRVPAFGRHGDMKIPRAWRALKGWRLLTPSRTRAAYPLAVWCGMAWRLTCRQHLDMAVFVLLLVSTYARTAELLRLRRGCLVPPAPGVTGHWAVLMNPEERSARSKTNTADDSVLVDSPWTGFLDPVLAVLRQGPAEELVWRFSYPSFLKEFRKCARDLRLEELTPYMTRHSGPSIDRANKWRSAAEVQKRGLAAS